MSQKHSRSAPVNKYIPNFVYKALKRVTHNTSLRYSLFNMKNEVSGVRRVMEVIVRRVERDRLRKI